jgi:hypothetical protein
MADTDDDVQSRRLFLRLGLLNGLFIGLALALGVWTLDAIFLSTSHVRLVTPSLLLGGLALALLGAAGGWLSAWVGRAWASVPIWLVTAGLMVYVIGHVPYEGRSLIVWLADRRAWGLPVYPFSDAAQAGMVLAGFFIVLLLGFLALIQSYRLEGIASETDAQGRLGARAWFLLLLPMPLVLLVGFVADAMVNRPQRYAPQLVHEAIRTGRTYAGDLFELSQRRGFNYNAISGVREQMGEDYVLSIGSVDLGVADTVFVVADFDNGAWINCRVVADQLSFCWDGSLPYLRGLSALVASGQIPEDCPQCFFQIDDELHAWLVARSSMFGGLPHASRVAQWGSYVLVRAEAPDGAYAVDCLFEGMSPVRLDRCWEVKTREGAAPVLPSADAGGLAEAVASLDTEQVGAGRVSTDVPRLDSMMWDPTDRLGPPPLSDPPTQVELGHYGYYISCMVCHGDEGQGLEAWRQVLPEDDRNCWKSRCHAANHPPEGFELPRHAPPLMGPGTLARFQTAAELYDYLSAQMPWQAPGILAGEEYWQITAFLAQVHGADPGDELLNREKAADLELHAESPGVSP